MLEKLFEKLLQKMVESSYPGRDMEMQKVGNNFFIVTHDTFGSLMYSLKGLYPYDKVKYLNSLTTYSARYGYCPQKGPIAIIGIPNSNIHKKYFQEVDTYGNNDEDRDKDFEFNEYSEEDAMKIGNYTVYGMYGMENITDIVKFDRITAVCDYRYKNSRNKCKILKMRCKLEGTYNFNEVENFAESQDRWAIDRSRAYATLEDGKHVAIMSFWYDRKDEVTGFRDVWESGCKEPPIQKINFMTKEEAAKITDFSIYLYQYQYFYKTSESLKIEKLDRTLSPDFDFYDTPDGKDLRLSENI